MGVRIESLTRDRRRLAPCGHPVPCGCDVGGSCCERCQFDPDFCKEDLPAGQRGLFMLKIAQRNRAIRRASEADIPVPPIADYFGLSERSIWRILQGGNGG